jgi:hypothetical protein
MSFPNIPLDVVLVVIVGGTLLIITLVALVVITIVTVVGLPSKWTPPRARRWKVNSQQFWVVFSYAAFGSSVSLLIGSGIGLAMMWLTGSTLPMSMVVVGLMTGLASGIGWYIFVSKRPG